MGIKGVGDIVEQVISVLKADLSSALSTIDTNMADGIVTPVPQAANYFRDEEPAIGGEFPCVYVYCALTDIVEAQESPQSRLHCAHTIRTFIYMRVQDTYDAETVRKFAYRYGTALALVLFARNPSLKVSGVPLPGVVSVSIQPIRYRDAFDDAGGYLGRNIIVSAIVKRIEIDA